MSAIPCSVCRRKHPGKLATAYWAWFLVDQARSAWKARYCPGCAEEALLALLNRSREADQSPEVFACISCGADASNDSDPIYLTLYLPGKAMMEFALQLDAVCAAKLRIPITQYGTKLVDRGVGVRGPSTSLTSAWDALGLEPI